MVGEWRHLLGFEHKIGKALGKQELILDIIKLEMYVIYTYTGGDAKKVFSYLK